MISAAICVNYTSSFTLEVAVIVLQKWSMESSLSPTSFIGFVRDAVSCNQLSPILNLSFFGLDLEVSGSRSFWIPQTTLAFEGFLAAF